MLSLGALAFLNPWLLPALAALPALWWLLRATPPRPKRTRFPGVRLLLGLIDPERTPDKTPWWLLLLRCAVAALAILAFAEPILNPKPRLAGDGPLLIAMDAGWASAPDWEARRARTLEALAQAERAGRPVAFVALAQPAPEGGTPELRAAADWRGEIEALAPAPWAPDRGALAARLAGSEIAEAVWITDGLAHDAEGDAALRDRLAAIEATLIGPETLAPGLRAPRLADGALATTALLAEAGPERAMTVAAFGAGETGGPRRLGQAQAAFDAEATEADAVFDLPLELRNRVERLTIDGAESAGATALADEGVRRRRAGLVSGGSAAETQRLISDLHYLRTALADRAELVEGDIGAVLESRPDVVFTADVGRFTDAEQAALTEWVEGGGLLVRFAGPRLARGADALGEQAMVVEDPLLPVRLRAGGRAVGGALAWAQPQPVREFPENSPFAGLEIPAEVTVSRQILAQLGPELPERTWAALADGTPLVTAAELGAGRVALFHVTANADWSNLPLSGLFVAMTERLLALSGGGAPSDRTALAGRTARPISVLDGFGRLVEAQGPGVPVERLDEAPGPDAPPGVYAVGDALIAFNLHGPDARLAPLFPPEGAALDRLGPSQERPIAPWLLALALLLLAVDTVATLILTGRLSPARRAAALALAAAAALAPAPGAVAQPADEAAALSSTLVTTFGHVVTGDPQVDALAAGGLRGLGAILTARTAVEPGEPAAVNLETDELGFYAILYWPVTADQPTPSDAAAAKVNGFLRTGGMILFDTRDQHMKIGAGATANQAALRRLTRGLDLPPLEPLPADHVLTRAFYLLEEFPGRHVGGRVWVEAAPDPEEQAEEGQPFRTLNDGVSPVVIGSADWAGAWAVDENGQFLAPIAGASGWRQREMAYRFGVNLAMYALTGNYKSDQVHVPALLERLGQ
jgi:hypothetical protein